jgi:hypothetical protein
MTIGYEVTLDEAALADARALFEFVGGNSDEALRVALNKTVPKIRTASSAAIRSQVRLSATYVRERLDVVRATRRNLTAAIKTPSRGLLLSRFSTDPLIAGEKVGWFKPPAVPAGGIRVKVKPDQGPKVVQGDAETRGNKPFYMVLNGGQNVGIAARLAGSRKVKVFSGPSLSQVFNTVRDDVLPEASTELTAQMLDAMRYLLQKQYPTEGAGA